MRLKWEDPQRWKPGKSFKTKKLSGKFLYKILYRSCQILISSPMTRTKTIQAKARDKIRHTRNQFFLKRRVRRNRVPGLVLIHHGSHLLLRDKAPAHPRPSEQPSALLHFAPSKNQGSHIVHHRHLQILLAVDTKTNSLICLYL